MRIWADRKDVLEDVYQILQGLVRRKQSTINLLWAWYGAGKSHTLLHITHLCKEKFNTLLPVYTEYPKTARSFRDLYCSMATGLPEELRSEIKVKTSDDAVQALADSVQKIQSAGFNRVIWMIDEFQRIGSERKNAWEDIVTGLHSSFNHAPNSFSLFLSFSVREKKEMFCLFSKELIDRIGIQKVIEIPAMTSSEALIFVSDLLYEFRSSDSHPTPWFPFEEETVRYIIWLLEERAELKPRSIMQYFSAVLERAESMLAMGTVKTIALEFAKQVLTGYDLFLYSSASGG